MSLLQRQVAAAVRENAINKRLNDDSYKSIVNAKKFNIQDCRNR